MVREVILCESPLEKAYVLDDSYLGPYLDSVRQQNYDGRARAILENVCGINGEFAGAHPFGLVHLQNSSLLPPNTRLATGRDLEVLISRDRDFLGKNSVNFGISLKTVEDSHMLNKPLSSRLFDQLRQKGMHLSNGKSHGKLIDFRALKLEENPESSYVLVFNLNGNLGSIQDLGSLQWDFVREGLSTAYRTEKGCYSDGWYLAESVQGSRVVVVQENR